MTSYEARIDDPGTHLCAPVVQRETQMAGEVVRLEKALHVDNDLIDLERFICLLKLQASIRNDAHRWLGRSGLMSGLAKSVS